MLSLYFIEHDITNFSSAAGSDEKIVKISADSKYIRVPCFRTSVINFIRCAFAFWDFMSAIAPNNIM